MTRLNNYVSYVVCPLLQTDMYMYVLYCRLYMYMYMYVLYCRLYMYMYQEEIYITLQASRILKLCIFVAR